MTTKAAQDNSLNKNNNLGISYGDKRRLEKQEALRGFLEGQKYIEAIHRTLESNIAPDELPIIKFKTETRLRLLNKILPDLKAVEVSGDEYNPIAITLIERVIVKRD
jgi:hypothetical protein